MVAWHRSKKSATGQTSDNEGRVSQDASPVKTRKDSATATVPQKPLAVRKGTARNFQPKIWTTVHGPQSPEGIVEDPEHQPLSAPAYADTTFNRMLVGAHEMHWKWGLAASFSTWILLAGYIVLPATFNSFQNDKELDTLANTQLKQKALHAARNIPLLAIAALCCVIGILGCLALWWKMRGNYIWLNAKIFTPALMNSVAGLISTAVNIYTAQKGQYSVTAIVTMAVTGSCAFVTTALFGLYNYWLLARVKSKHYKVVGKPKETKDPKKSKKAEKRLTGGNDYVDKMREKRGQRAL